jgi:hypothetical protein
MGAPIASISPAAVAAAPAAALIPQVDSYDEETYHCRANDNFRTISTQFYRTDKYGQALWLFNRNHPLATDMVRQDPPVLQPGQQVYIPPIRILEKYYSSAITETPIPAGNAEATPTIVPASATIDRLYRVNNSEMLWQIAARTLGKSDRCRHNPAHARRRTGRPREPAVSSFPCL